MSLTSGRGALLVTLKWATWCVLFVKGEVTSMVRLTLHHSSSLCSLANHPQSRRGLTSMMGRARDRTVLLPVVLTYRSTIY